MLFHSCCACCFYVRDDALASDSLFLSLDHIVSLLSSPHLYCSAVVLPETWPANGDSTTVPFLL